MKESKKRENLSSKKKKHGSKTISLDSWDQSDLEFADEKVLERRLHQLKLQLQMAQDEAPDSGRSNKHTKNKKKPPPPSDDSSSDSDSSDSNSSFSSASSSSVDRYDNKKSSSPSEDDRKRRHRSLVNKKKAIKEIKITRTARNDRENNSSKNDKKITTRRKVSPVQDKRSSRIRSKRSPSLDKKEVYSRMDTSRWHDKAKEIGRERSKHRENDNDRSRARSRVEQNRNDGSQKDQRAVARSKERNTKKPFARNTSVSSRRKESPEPARTRVGHDTGRRAALFARKSSPRDERLGRHDERRLDVKVNRRNEIRAGDNRDVNIRIAKETRDRKEPSIKLRDKSKEREPLIKSHRESAEFRNDIRDRNRIIEDRVKERDKRLHERIEPDRNIRNVRNDIRDIPEDKFRRLDRSPQTNRITRQANESVFDRMRNRYNDRRNAINQRFGRLDRDRVNDVRKDRINDKEPIKSRTVDANDADRIFRDRRTNIPIPTRLRSPHRDRKEAFRSVERRTPVNFERKFSSPTATKKARDDNRPYNKRRSLENDDLQWNKKKGLNKTKSRSRSSERRKRRRSSQEEWRVIDMTSPLLDDELSDENVNKSTENNIHNRLKQPATNRFRNEENDDNDNSKLNKTILTDELSDISDEDFSDPNATNLIKNKKDGVMKSDRQLRIDKNMRKIETKTDSELIKKINQDNKNNGTNDMDDIIIKNEKLADEESSRIGIEKDEPLDSEEETVSRVSDAIGVDWAELVEDSKKKVPDVEESSKLVRKRWSGVNIFSRIGFSEKYAGKDLFEEVQKDLSVSNDGLNENQNVEKNANGETNEKILHNVPGIHVCLRDRAIKRRTLFEPYKTAISARKDIIIRRRLCGLPVKNINAQHMIGICHWIV